MTTIADHPALPLDPVAFVAALILAPVAFTAMTFWLLLIPVGALIFGYLPYLFFGTPVLLAILLTGPATEERVIMAAVITVAAGWLAIVIPSTLFAPQMYGFHAVWGAASLAFAIGWAGTFASLYSRFYRAPLALN